MINKIAITIGFFTLLFASSCSNEAEEELKNLPFESISFSQLCGWCVAGHSITIENDETVKFSQTFPCKPEDNIEKSRPLTEDEVQSIIEVFQLEAIESIDLDQCGECYDGCDDTLVFEKSDESNHLIRYDQFDKYDELVKIKDLVETLQKIRDSF